MTIGATTEYTATLRASAKARFETLAALCTAKAAAVEDPEQTVSTGFLGGFVEEFERETAAIRRELTSAVLIETKPLRGPGG